MFLAQVFDLLAFDEPDAAVALGEVVAVLGHPRCGYQDPVVACLSSMTPARARTGSTPTAPR